MPGEYTDPALVPPVTVGSVTMAQVTGLNAALAPLTAHVAATGNVHGLTKSQLGLGNVDNTADANKPVSTAQASAINAAKAEAKARENHTGEQAMTTITGLGAAITDAKARANHTGVQPISSVTDLQSALDSKVAQPIIATELEGEPVNGVAGVASWVKLDLQNTLCTGSGGILVQLWGDMLDASFYQLPVAIADGDNSSVIAGKIRAALLADSAVTTGIEVFGSTRYVELRDKEARELTAGLAISYMPEPGNEAALFNPTFGLILPDNQIAVGADPIPGTEALCEGQLYILGDRVWDCVRQSPSRWIERPKASDVMGI